MNRALLAAPLALASLFVIACSDDADPAGTNNNQGTGGLQKGAPCSYAGATFEDGRTFSSPDGCNSCRCTDGVAMCTKRACVPLPPVDAGILTPDADVAVADAAVEPEPIDAGPPDATIAKPDAGGCVYGGIPRSVGDSFKSLDGCNTCFCSQNGSVPCTKKLCKGDAGGP